MRTEIIVITDTRTGKNVMRIRAEIRAGGELLKQGDDIAAAIQRVAQSLGFDDLLAQNCIDDLPAEEI